MRSSILTLSLACALGLAAPGVAEDAAPQATSPAGGGNEAAPADAAAAQGAEPVAGAEADASATPKAEPAAKPGAESARSEGHHAVVLGPAVTDAQGRQGRLHVVQRGDTLWDISDAYLGTPWVWPSIWKDNADIQNPHRIYPGDKLFVSPSEMRRLSDEEAARMLAGGEQAPAALADGLPTASEAAQTYRFPEIETVGFVSTEAVNGAAAIVDSNVDRVWLGDHDRVIVGLGEGQVAPGDRFDIFRTTSTVKDPDTGLPLGHAVLALGWLEVEKVHPETSTAIIRVSRGEIRRGDRLLPRIHALSTIPIQAKPDVVGRVAYTWAGRVETGGNDVVYLNRGSTDGLEVGSPLEVYRPIGTGRDDARNQELQLPDHTVARMLVLTTTPDTATAVVTHAFTEVEKGDYFRGSDTIWY
jgi:LysM domain